MAHRTGRRSVGGTSRRSQHSEAIRENLAADPLWRFFTLDSRWICPYCLTAIRAPQSGSSTQRHTSRNPMSRAIERHLTGRCPAFLDGKGHPQPEEVISVQVQHENIGYLAMTDPAWQVFDHEGFWYNPATLKKVRTVRIQNRRFDNFTVQQIVRHMANCQEFLQGHCNPKEQVQAARDAGIRVSKLAHNISKLLGHKIWRYRDAAGNWISPYCLTHVTSVNVQDERDWPQMVEEMARFLLQDCPVFGPKNNQIRSEEDVAAAAKTPPPTGSVPAPQSPGSSSSSGRTPIATPIGAVNTISDEPPVAKPVSPPVAMPVTDNRSGPVPPPPDAIRPTIEPEQKHTTTQYSPNVIPPSNQEPPAAVPVDDVATQPGTGLFGNIGGDPLAGSFLDENTSQSPPMPSPVEGDTSGTFSELVGSGWSNNDDESSGSFRPVTAGDDPLNWMEELSADESKELESDSHRAEQEEDLIKAREVQVNMLKKAPEIEGFTFASRFESCTEVSGDFYEYLELKDGRIGFAQGDVSGHGMQAGLIMSMAKKVLAIYGQQFGSPSQVLSAVNDSLVEDLAGRMFVSMTYAILDPIDRTITWSRAGHNPTVHFNIKRRELKEINPPGMVVGMKGGPLFAKVTKEEVTQLESGDLFLVYTDGVTETMNRQGEEYGTEQLNELLKQHANEDLEVLLDRILDSVRSFRGGGETQDDMTMTALLVD